jgi:hypothetical protein
VSLDGVPAEAGTSTQVGQPLVWHANEFDWTANGGCPAGLGVATANFAAASDPESNRTMILGQ